MSFATQAQTAESQDSTANDDDNDDFAPQPITSRYESVKAHLSLLKDAIGAVDDFGMEDTDLPAVKWANAIESALYTDDGCLGEQQKETPYTTSDFKEVYGDSITTPHDDLTDGERTQLKGLFKESDNHDVEALSGEFKLPVINDERLPLLVADEDVLEEAVEMLEAIVAEGNDASSTTPDVDDEGGYTVLEGTLDDLEAHLADSTPDEETLREMLKVEQANKDRKGADDLITSAIDAHDESDEGDDESDDTDDDDASSTTSEIDTEELATTVAQAVVEALDN